MTNVHLAGKLAVILHADVAGSTQMVQQDEHLAHRRIQDTFHLLSDIVNQYSGRVLELRGDALLAEFERPSDAVAATLRFQSSQSRFLASINDGLKPEVRVGIALGEVVIADNTITGAGVVVAQRVEQLADAGGLCITAAVRESLSGRLPVDLEGLGLKKLKGFEEPVSVYKVRQADDAVIPPPEPQSAPAESKVTLVNYAVLMAIFLIVAAGSVYWINKEGPLEEPVTSEPSVTPTLARPSIAVLPFTNMSSDPEQEYFADGMTEDLITDISRISGLKVIARHSTFSYKGRSLDVRDVGKELNASHVIEGSVRKAGDTVRITIQLIDASDGQHVWAERYDRELRDVFTIQDEVIGEIITALSLKLTPDEERRVNKHGTENLAAYDLFMRGRQQESYFNQESFIEAQRYYEQAVALDSSYAEAWAHLAQIHAMNGQFGWVDDIAAANQRALRLVEKSIALDRDIPFVRFSYSRILARDSIGQQSRAIEEAKAAIELDPNYADAHAYLGQLYILTGQAEKTIEPITTAMGINPNFPFWYHYTYGFAHFFLGDYEKAAKNIEKAVERNPNVFFLRTAYAASLAMAGRLDDAEWQIDELYGLGFNKSLEEFISETPVQDPAYRALYREGLEKAGLS
jgi:adenylate cyclase